MDNCNDRAACIGRREFLVKAGLVAGASVLTISSLGRSALALSFEDVTVEITADGPLSKAGGSQVVDSTAGAIIVVNEGDGKYAAFSARCTHKGGIVAYDASSKRLVCPKHGSAFDGMTGAVVNGPADAPLKSYPAKVGGQKVTVSVS